MKNNYYDSQQYKVVEDFSECDTREETLKNIEAIKIILKKELLIQIKEKV